MGGGYQRGDVGGIGGRREVVVWGDGALSGGFAPRPGKSGRGCGSWSQFPANFGKVGLKFRALGGGNVVGPDVACLVGAVAEAFSLDEPAGTHPVGVASFGTILCAFAGEVPRPILALLE